MWVTAKPRAQTTLVEQTDPTHFVVSVPEPPVEGRANKAIVRALAEHFRVSPSAVRFVSGFTSRQKVFDVRV